MRVRIKTKTYKSLHPNSGGKNVALDSPKASQSGQSSSRRYVPNSLFLAADVPS